jgi:6-phosphogluconate dehydrogenase
MKKQLKVGVIGLSTMGSNLVSNLLANSSESLSEIIIYNRSYEKTLGLLGSYNDSIMKGFEILSDFIESKPDFIFLLVKAGEPTDLVIKELLSLGLDKNSVIVDFGNSNPKDSLHRFSDLEKQGYNYAVCGISGGSAGARNGASLMYSGYYSLDLLEILKTISAKDFNNNPTVDYFGSSNEGNYIKTVHNGIEYAQLEMLAELYQLLKNCSFSNLEISKQFSTMAKNEKDYLLSVFSNICEENKYKISNVLPIVESKGTGKWTTEIALEHEIPLFYIPLAYNIRLINQSEIQTKVKENQILESDKEETLKTIYSLYNYGYQEFLKEGLNLLKAVCPNLEINKVKRVWQGGCIIRNKQLDANNNYLFPKNYIKNEGLLILSMLKTMSEIQEVGLDQLSTIAIARNIFGDHKMQEVK